VEEAEEEVEAGKWRWRRRRWRRGMEVEAAETGEGVPGVI